MSTPASPTSPSAPARTRVVEEDLARPGEEPPAHIRPSGRWYTLAAGVAILGTAVGIGVLLVSASQLEVGAGTYRRVEVPGDVTLEIDRTGEYQLYAETSEDRDYDQTVDPPVVTVDGPDDRELSVRSTTVSTRPSHTHEGRDGYKFGSFVASRPGRYVVSVRTRTESDPEARTQAAADPVLVPEVVAVESPIRPAALAGAIGGGILMAASWLAGFILWFVILVRRGSSRRAAMAASARVAEGPRVPPGGPVAPWSQPAAVDPWADRSGHGAAAAGASRSSDPSTVERSS